MEKSAKKYLLSLLSTGHRHESMDKMMECNFCAVKFQKAKKEYNRLVKEHPEVLPYQEPEYPDSPELNEMRMQLASRLKYDPLYKKHIELSFKGTPAERKRENERANSGYYTRHSQYKTPTSIIIPNQAQDQAPTKILIPNHLKV